MREREIAEDNRLISEFMGYKYHHKGVDIEQEYPNYKKKEIFSKVPIEVEEFKEDNQCYFKDFPNPDYGQKYPKKWNPSYAFINWGQINYGKYIMDLDYHSNWNSLMTVVIKIESPPGIRVEISGYLCNIYKMKRNPSVKENSGFKELLLISEKHNDKLHCVWNAVVRYIKKDFEKQ